MSESRFRSKPVPFLLESFPVPPSFIPNATQKSPPSTLPYHNPPPTLPPTSPLPPLPGPSPISDEETVLLLSSSHLRRLSRISTNSVASSKRDSTATIASVTSIGSNGVPSLSPSVSGSSSSTSQSSSPPRTHAESGISVAQSLRSFSSNGSLSVLPFSRSQQQPDKSPRLSPTMKVAIKEEDSEIQSLSLHYSDMDPEVSPHIPTVISRDVSIDSIDMQDLPSVEYCNPVTLGRTSPDIRTILSATPKPRRRTTSVLSSDAPIPRTSLPTSEMSSSSSSAASTSQTIKRPDSSLSQLRRAISSSLGDDDDDGMSDFDELERELEGNGSESDSSLDLHTPFAHVMLRDGLISPRSKVISAINPEIPRPGSVLSTNSLRTKSGVYKDDRDTLKRRHRHRDGKLLRAGMGLTTGLGWSDSEDEDSPSPLTRRLSNMAMSRKSSSSSMRSTRSAPVLSVSRTSSIGSDYVSRTLRRTTKSSKLSISSSSSLWLPTTLETIEDVPPIPPPKDVYQVDTSTKSGATSMNATSIKSTPASSSVTSSTSVSGHRPLKLSQTGSVLRSSSLGQVNASPQGPRPRTYSQPLNIKSGLPGPPPSSFKSSLTMPRKSLPAPTTPSSLPDSPNDSSELQRRRSRIGTGMVYKRSTSDPSVSSPAPSLAARSTITSAPASSIARPTFAAPSTNSNSQSTPSPSGPRSIGTRSSTLSPPTRGMGGGGSMNMKKLRMPSSPSPLGNVLTTMQQGRPGMPASMLRSSDGGGVGLGVAM